MLEPWAKMLLISKGSSMSDVSASKQQIGSAFSLLSKSAQIVKANWPAFALVNGLAILSALGQMFEGPDKIDSNWAEQFSSRISGLSGGELAAVLGVGFGVVLLFAVVAVFLFAMATSLEVKSSAGKKPKAPELFKDGQKFFFRIIGLMILVGLMVIGGFILLIIPGIIAIGRLAMAPYHMVDKDTGVMEAIRQSNALARGKMSLVYAAIGVTALVSILASIVGVVPIIGPLVGVAITIAYSLVLALRYQQLKKI